MSKVTIPLTEEQRKQIKKATGKDMTELNIDLTATGNLTEKELDKVAGGAIGGNVKLTGGIGQL